MSTEHRDQVLVSMTLNSSARRSPGCNDELRVEAAGALLRCEARERDDLVSHHVIAADEFETLGARGPLRVEICGNQFGFGHRELRALPSFIRALAEIRARPREP